MLSSCINYDDASKVVDIRVHLMNPAEFKADAALSDQEVTIKSVSTEMRAVTDANGIATFSGCMPDVYDISSYKELTGEEYAEKTGEEDAVESCTVTATLNGQLFDEAREQSPIEVETSTIVKKAGEKSIVISKIASSGSKKTTGGTYAAGKYF
jgi:hypothetical protein